jgi:hypothetical protein
MCPGSWLPKEFQAGIMGAKAVDLYAFSWGVPRKPAGNVVETTQRKSQVSYFPLEKWSGSEINRYEFGRVI